MREVFTKAVQTDALLTRWAGQSQRVPFIYLVIYFFNF